MLELSCLGNCDGRLDALSRLQPCATAAQDLDPSLRPFPPEDVMIPPRASVFVGVKTSKNKKGSRDKISQPLELYGRDGVIRTLDP